MSAGLAFGDRRLVAEPSECPDCGRGIHAWSRPMPPEVQISAIPPNLDLEPVTLECSAGHTWQATRLETEPMIQFENERSWAEKALDTRLVKGKDSPLEIRLTDHKISVLKLLEHGGAHSRRSSSPSAFVRACRQMEEVGLVRRDRQRDGYWLLADRGTWILEVEFDRQQADLEEARA